MRISCNKRGKIIANVAACAVHTAVGYCAPNNSSLPVLLKYPFAIIHKIHQIWRHWFRGRRYLDGGNFAKLLAGHTLNAIAGKNRWLQVTAQCVLIAHRILSCIDEQVAVWHSCKKLRDDLLVRYPQPIKIRWSSDFSSNSILSPSTAFWWRTFVWQSVSYLKLLAVRTGQIVLHLFKLSMVTLDAIEAFSFKPKMAYEAVSELFINSAECLDKCATNSERLLNQLQEKRFILAKVFSSLKIPFSIEQLINGVKGVVNNVEQMNHTVQGIDSTVNSLAQGIGKQGAFGFMSAIGLSNGLPDRFIPPIAPTPPLINKQNKNKNFGRFAPTPTIEHYNIASKAKDSASSDFFDPPDRTAFSSVEEAFKDSLNNFGVGQIRPTQGNTL